jgi:excinuclease Cho
MPAMRTHVSSVGLVIAANPADDFLYPQHIPRSCLDLLPPQPGIYVFRDQQGTPIYIGKSVNIRSRVLSHLRTPGEARMLQQTAHIDFERTGGEIGALLLESKLIKKWQPAYNRKLRRVREMCSLHLPPYSGSACAPSLVYAREIDFAGGQYLYGLFASKASAMETLRNIVGSAQLCPALTGLEAAARGRPCFASQIGRCRGACCGKESAEQHAERLRAALYSLRVLAWPFEGAIGVVEESDGWRQTQLIDRWCYLGPAEEVSGKPRRRKAAAARQTLPVPRFEMDTYQILLKPLLLGELTLELRLESSLAPLR